MITHDIWEEAALGGTAEQLGGGKFANGAITGAYTVMFNHFLHEGDKAKNAEKERISFRSKRYSVDEAIMELNNNALENSSGYCAKYVRFALEAGGITIIERPGSAKDYAKLLMYKDFYIISHKNYSPQTGDIVVMNSFLGYKNHPHGHIQMYNGNQWISDFKQKGFWPGSDYRQNKPNYIIFRW